MNRASAAIWCLPWILRPQNFNVEKFTQTAKSYDKPITAWVLGAGDHADKLIRDLTSAGIPAVDEPAKAVRILAALTMRR